MESKYKNQSVINNQTSIFYLENDWYLSNISDSIFLNNNISGVHISKNETRFDIFQIPGWLYILMTIIYICIFILGVLGNLLVIVVITKDRRMWNTANFYLISLGMADLMVIMFCLPVAAYELHAEEVWSLGPTLCKLAPLLQYLSTNASISTMVAISIERFIVICRPFKVRTYCTKRRAVGIILVVWAFSFFCSFPLLMFTIHKPAYHQKLEMMVHVCYINYYESEGYFYFHQTFFYALPGLALCFLYTKIVFTLRRFNSEHFGHSPDSRRNKNPAAKSETETNQLIAMLSTVVLCYFFCLLPYNLITFLTLVSPQTLLGLGPTAYYVFLDVSRILFFVNSCSNPILYNAISSKFRSAFSRLFCPPRFRAGRDSRTGSVRSGEIRDLYQARLDEYYGSSSTKRSTRRTVSTIDREYGRSGHCNKRRSESGITRTMTDRSLRSIARENAISGECCEERYEEIEDGAVRLTTIGPEQSLLKM